MTEPESEHKSARHRDDWANRRDALVSDFMNRECKSEDNSDSLGRTVESMADKNCSTMPVMQAGSVKGILPLGNVSEMIMVNAASDRSSKTVR